MDKCNCWEEIEKATGYYKGFPMEVKNKIQICNGTKEREECSCDGSPEKCTFYPEKRKENKTMNTDEMYLQAQKDGMCYKIINKEKCSEDLFYQKNKGFFDIYGDTCYTNIWNYFDDMMQEQWMLNTMTKTEAERALGVKIID